MISFDDVATAANYDHNGCGGVVGDDDHDGCGVDDDQMMTIIMSVVLICINFNIIACCWLSFLFYFLLCFVFFLKKIKSFLINSQCILLREPFR